MKISDKRNYGVDLLRLVSMLMVVTLHVLGKGNLLSNDMPTSSYWSAWTLEIAAYGAVDIFALISGYVGYKSSFKLSRMIKIYIQTLFWCLVIYGIYIASGDRPHVPIVEIMMLVSERDYWFITDYIALCLFMPMLNFVINNMPKKTLILMLLGIITVFCVYPDASVKDSFGLVKGYSFARLMILYLIGGTLAKYKALDSKGKKFYLSGYLIMVGITVLHTFYMSWLDEYRGDSSEYKAMLVSYISPTVIGASICMLGLFSKMKLPDIAKKAVAIFSPCALGVYVIHENMYVKRFFMVDWAEKAGITTDSPLDFMPHVFGAIMFVFSVCLVLDFLREQLFRLVQIPKLLGLIDKKFSSLVEGLKM